MTLPGSASRSSSMLSAARRAALVVASCLVASCSPSVPAPASVDLKNDQCAHCRMMVVDVRFAAQLVAPGEEPKFFDDIGCLRAFLSARPALAADTVAYVADHRTKAWVPAAKAVYVRNPALDTPMSSHVIAFATAASRDEDRAASGGEALDAAGVFEGVPVPGGER